MPEAAQITRQTIAIFDMDRTITRHGTFTPFLISTIGGQWWRFLLLPVVAVLMISYQLGLITRKRLKEFMIGFFLKGMSPEQLAAHVEQFVTRLLERSTFPGALRQIEAHKAAGDRLVIATASMDFYVDLVATRLDFDTIVATKSSRTADGRLSGQLTGQLTGKIEGENCYGAPKLDMVLAALPDIVGPEVVGSRSDYHIIAYSDHVSDAPLLEWADKAVAVNPSSGLRRMAADRGWEIADWA